MNLTNFKSSLKLVFNFMNAPALSVLP
ncbi:hypothetical protein MXB_3060 [Myxobolus squamalis]|nr:hypothetical protein MXB_3060 [Myxobolus squamalis]